LAGLDCVQPKRPGKRDAGGKYVGDYYLCAASPLSDKDSKEPNRPGANDGDCLSFLDRGTRNAVDGYGERLNQRAGLRVHTRSEANQILQRKRNEIGHTSWGIDSIEAQIAADVRVAGSADQTMPAGDKRVCRDALSYFEFIRVGANFHYAAAKLVTEGERRFGAWMQAG
jgi:hypothetical protein